MRDTFCINGKTTELTFDGGDTLLRVLRENSWTEVKEGCDAGECGACLVLLDGVPVNACQVFAATAAHRDIVTVAGIAAAWRRETAAAGTPAAAAGTPATGAAGLTPAAADGTFAAGAAAAPWPATTSSGPATSSSMPDRLHPLQRAFVETGAVQCGFCTPAMIIAAYHLLERSPDPTDEEIRTALDGNLCRCTGYVKILAAVRLAAERMAGAPGARGVHGARSGAEGGPVHAGGDPAHAEGGSDPGPARADRGTPSEEAHS